MGETTLPTIIHDPRLLHERFLKACRTTTGPVLAVSDVTLLTNTSAAALIRPSDRALLWTWAREETLSAVRGTRAPRPVTLPSGARPHLHEPIWTGPALTGAAIRLTPPAHHLENRPTTSLDLTDSQRLIAEHVAHGLTNRQTAAALSVSPHTVDYHLRHIFRKLHIHSRVELARLVAEGSVGRESLRV